MGFLNLLLSSDRPEGIYEGAFAVLSGFRDEKTFLTSGVGASNILYEKRESFLIRMSLEFWTKNELEAISLFYPVLSLSFSISVVYWPDHVFAWKLKLFVVLFLSFICKMLTLFCLHFTDFISCAYTTPLYLHCFSQFCPCLPCSL